MSRRSRIVFLKWKLCERRPVAQGDASYPSEGPNPFYSCLRHRARAPFSSCAVRARGGGANGQRRAELLVGHDPHE
eukprot:8330375-Pyramimonas_sp.AAC.1